jgi:hypothetical protein
MRAQLQPRQTTSVLRSDLLELAKEVVLVKESDIARLKGRSLPAIAVNTSGRVPQAFGDQCDNDGEGEEPVAELEPAHQKVDRVVDDLKVQEEEPDDAVVALVHSGKAIPHVSEPFRAKACRLLC